MPLRTAEDLSPEEQLGQTLVAFVDIDSAELVRPAIEQGKIEDLLKSGGQFQHLWEIQQ